MKRLTVLVILTFSLLMVNLPFAQQRGMRAVGKHASELPNIVYRTGWALLIGINKYPNLPGRYQLDYAVADAEAIAELLERKFGFPKSNITILKNEQATKYGIMDALSSLADPDKVEKDDCILVFYSGHGQTVELPKSRGGGNMGFLVPYDAKLDLSEEPNAARYYQYCVGMDELKRVARLIPAKHLLFILDACYSGLVLQSSRGLEREIPSYLKKVATVSTQQMITAGGKGEQSVERPEFGHGVFTYKMLEGLENGIADWDDDGVITGSELGTYLRMTVPKMSKQTPQFRMEGEGEFMFLPQVEGESEQPAVIEEIEELKSTAKLVADSEPKGASVYVDNKKLGETPCTIEIDVGVEGKREVVVAVSKEGYQVKRARVKLTAGKAARWTNIRLEELTVAAPAIIEPIPEPPATAEPAVAPYSPMATGLEDIVSKDGVQMALIPAGEFQTGDGAAVHKVHLDAFYIDKYEVTNAQYKKFMDATGRRAPAQWNYSSFNAPNQPVVGVNWHDAKAYCEWAGKRLPTEAEWEKAARGGLIGKKYPRGNTITHDDANYYGTGSKDRWSYTAPVGSFAPNGYGLYDMAGNVWEWCADWYDAKYYSRSPAQNPEGPDSGKNRVLRGGSWNLNTSYLLVTKRYNRSPESRYDDLGFRCAMDVTP